MIKELHIIVESTEKNLNVASNNDIENRLSYVYRGIYRNINVNFKIAVSDQSLKVIIYDIFTNTAPKNTVIYINLVA